MRFCAVIASLAVAAATTPALAQMDRTPSLPTPNSVFLEDLTWMELRDAIAAG